MTEIAVHTYWDYANRFLGWRVGDFRPRDARGPGPALRTGSASVDDLTNDAKEYARDVDDSGKQQITVDTYYRHAMFFVRWLDGSFIPGARLRNR
jgi:hypothetical protein